MKIWIVTAGGTVAGRPATPLPFLAEAAAELHADQQLRAEWEAHGPETTDGARLPYPGDWRQANALIAEDFRSDGSVWGEYTMAVHDVDTPADAALATRDLIEALTNLLAPGSVSASVIEDGRDLLARMGHDVRVPPQGDLSAMQDVSAGRPTITSDIGFKIRDGIEHQRFTKFDLGDDVQEVGMGYFQFVDASDPNNLVAQTAAGETFAIRIFRTG